MRTRAWWHEQFLRAGWRQDPLHRMLARACQQHELPRKMGWQMYMYAAPMTASSSISRRASATSCSPRRCSSRSTSWGSPWTSASTPITRRPRTSFDHGASSARSLRMRPADRRAHYDVVVPAMPPFYWRRFARGVHAFGRARSQRPPDRLFAEDEQAYYLAFARTLGYPRHVRPACRLPIGPRDDEDRVGLGTVVLAPGCKTGQMAAKRWPHFAELAERFRRCRRRRDAATICVTSTAPRCGFQRTCDRSSARSRCANGGTDGRSGSGRRQRQRAGACRGRGRHADGDAVRPDR